MRCLLLASTWTLVLLGQPKLWVLWNVEIEGSACHWSGLELVSVVASLIAIAKILDLILRQVCNLRLYGITWLCQSGTCGGPEAWVPGSLGHICSQSKLITMWDLAWCLDIVCSLAILEPMAT